MHYKSIPNVVYTWPEIAAVGLTEREVKESGREYRVGKFPFSANGRARTMGESAGFVKFIADARTDELHWRASRRTERVGARRRSRTRFRVSCVGRRHRHHRARPPDACPKSTKEAALAALGRALHI